MNLLGHLDAVHLAFQLNIEQDKVDLLPLEDGKGCLAARDSIENMIPHMLKCLSYIDGDDRLVLDNKD